MATATDLKCTTTTIIEGRLSNFSESSSSSSVSDQEDYSRTNSGVRQSRKWRKLIKKMVAGSKRSFYGSSKPSIFRYDAVSYSLNFDEGNHGDEYYSCGSRFSHVLGECS